MQGSIRGMVQTRASHTSLMHSFTGGRLGVIPSKRAFSGRIEFDEGSSRSRVVVGSSCTRFVVVRGHDEELDVHGIFEGRR